MTSCDAVVHFVVHLHRARFCVCSIHTAPVAEGEWRRGDLLCEDNETASARAVLRVPLYRVCKIIVQTSRTGGVALAPRLPSWRGPLRTRWSRRHAGSRSPPPVRRGVSSELRGPQRLCATLNQAECPRTARNRHANAPRGRSACSLCSASSCARSRTTGRRYADQCRTHRSTR